VQKLPEFVYHLEEPFADAAFVPTFALSRFACEKVKVILSGAGGDELFGGYFHHREYSMIKAMESAAAEEITKMRKKSFRPLNPHS